LKSIQTNDLVDLQRDTSKHHWSKKLEELGIGRPSTYAPTISTVQKRGYVEKKIKDGKERHYLSMLLKDEEIESSTKSEITGREKKQIISNRYWRCGY
jgi:hypothetical protein